MDTKQAKKTLYDFNAVILLISYAVFIALTYIWFQNANALTDTIKTGYYGAVVSIILAFMTREKRLLEIREAQAIALNDALLAQNRGELKEQGRITIIEDGRLRYVNNEPEGIYVAAGIEGVEPKVLVYVVHPYTGYIKSITKVDVWHSYFDADLKIVIPPTWIDFLRTRQEYGGAQV